MEENKSQYDNQNKTQKNETTREPESTDSPMTDTPLGAAGPSTLGGSESKISGVMIAAIIVGAALIAGGLYYYFQGSSDSLTISPSSDATSATTNNSEADAEEYPDVVARVNGEELTNDQFVTSLNQVRQAAAQQGQDLEDASVTEEMETQAMDTLINTALLIQAAQNSDIEISDQAVTDEIDSLVGQFPSQEAFDQAVADQGLSSEELRSDMRDQLLIDEFVAESDDIGSASVTEAEVEELYNNLSAQQEGLPPLEQIYASIEQQLAARKQQQLISDFIEQLRETADIEILI